MLFSEFQENTKCKDTPFNNAVYKALEGLYMENDLLSKEAVYKAGKLLVDNSETPAEKETREQAEKEIRELENTISFTEDYIRQCKHNLIDEDTRSGRDYYRDRIREETESLRGYKAQLKSIKTLFR